MKIVVNRKSLNACLGTLSVALPTRNVLPINFNFLFDIKEDGKCDVYARNSELQMKGFMTVSTKEAIKICVPGTTLMNTVKLLTEEEINFNYNPEKFVLNISAGKKRYKLTGENPKDYVPQQIPDDAVEYKTLASKIIPHVATLSKVVDWKDMRPQLQGITFNVIKNDLILSGTHGAFFFCRCVADRNVDADFRFILPRECSMALAQMKGVGDIEVSIGKRAVFFRLEGFELRSTIVDCSSVIEIDKYFVYDEDSYLMVNKDEFSMSTKRMINYADSDDSTLRIEVKGEELVLSSDNVDFGREAEEIIDVSNKNSKDVIVGLNMRYASAILSAISADTIKAFFVNYNKPVFFQDGEKTEDSQVWGCAPIILKEHLKN